MKALHLETSTLLSLALLLFLNLAAYGVPTEQASPASQAAETKARPYECKERPRDLAEAPKMDPPSPKDRKGKQITFDAAKELTVQTPCPEGQLPVPRERVAPKGNPFFSPTAVDAPYQYADAFATAGGEIRPFDGGGVVTVVENPAVSSASGTHSLFEIAVQGGVGNGDIVEIGWTKNRGDSDSHLFVFHWIGWNPTCYNGCGWVQWNPNIFPGMTLQAGSHTYMGWVYYAPQGNWWAWYGNQWVGYYPGTRWKGGYTRSTLVQWFGEVYEEDPTPETDMGNGLRAADTAAARFWFPCEVDAAAWVCWINPSPSLNQPSLPWYSIANVGGFALRYGGPGGRVGVGLDP